MPELIDKEATLKNMCESCGYCEKFEKAMRTTYPDFVTDKCNNYKFLSEQPTIEPQITHGKLIDLDELLKFPIRLDHYDKENGDEHFVYGVEAVLEYAENLPVIEAEPVRHGQWIQSDALDYKDPNGVIHVHGMCSCCRMIYDFRDMTSRFRFCPNCGANMIEVKEDVGSKTN